MGCNLMTYFDQSKNNTANIFEKLMASLLPVGRINRLGYLNCIFFLSISGTISVIALTNFVGLTYFCDQLWLVILLHCFAFLFFGLTSVGLYLFFVFSMKRLHDFNESGYWAILLFVPLVNILLVLYLLLMPGDKLHDGSSH